MRNRPGGLNVISLFNGHGGIWLVLESMGIKVNKRYVSEIDKFPSQANDALYEDTIHLGDVTLWESWDLSFGVDWDEIDLVVGGSPCQGFSVAGKGLAFEDPRSKLFFEFIKIRDKCKNADWMLENIRMKAEWLQTIDKHIGLKGVMINSSLVSAQKRRRYYWSNLTITQPDDQEIFLEDILESGEVSIRPISENEMDIIDRTHGEVRVRQATVKGYAVAEHGDSINFSNPNSKTRRGRVGKKKSNTLDTSCNQGVLINGHIRKLTPRECGRLQTVPEDKLDIMLSCGVTDSQLLKMFGNGWTLAAVAHVLTDLKHDELW
jgi:DNA (cytosine-5)-methyltransferase 3A